MPSLVFLPPAGTCSLRPSLGATLRAAVAVQIVYPDNLSLNHSYGYAFGPRIKYGAGSGTRWRHKSARSRFGRPQDARRVCAMEGAHQKSGAIIASIGEICWLTQVFEYGCGSFYGPVYLPGSVGTGYKSCFIT